MTERGNRGSGQNWRRVAVWTAVVSAAAAVGVIALLVSIFEHKQEARNPFYRVVELTDDSEDPEIWGKNFPFQYDGYKRTTDQVRTRFGGSEALPRTPTAADPREPNGDAPGDACFRLRSVPR